MYEALMCLFTIATKYNEPLASVNRDSDDDGYDIVTSATDGQPATGPLRSATRMQHRFHVCNPSAQCK